MDRRNIVLIGYRGCGKTTTGRLLADALGYAFVDTDDLISERAGKSIGDIFEQDGESAFRALEREVILDVARRTAQVLSLGGGAVMDGANVQVLRATGTVFWLTAPAEVLWERMCHDPVTEQQRPDLAPGGGLDEVRRVLADRVERYRSAADHVVDTANLSTEQTVAEIVELFAKTPRRLTDQS